MFSTDANARCFPTFNPSPLQQAKYNFAILGQDINSYEGTGKPKVFSGTSFATIIGGALAGSIIDFSRHTDGRKNIRRGQSITTVAGMSAIFAKMATEDGRYHCLVPWRLLRSSEQDEDDGDGGEVGMDRKARREAERRYICETISRALEGMYT